MIITQLQYAGPRNPILIFKAPRLLELILKRPARDQNAPTSNDRLLDTFHQSCRKPASGVSGLVLGLRV